MGHFSRSLIRLRTRGGFKTAYNFYHSNGGRRIFPFTYAHYLKIERGGSLPQPSALRIMLKLFSGAIQVQERRELTHDYLRDLSGDGAVYDELFAPLHAPAGEGSRENALPLILGRLNTNVTPAQFQAIVSSPEATGCFMLFANVPDALSIEKIAGSIGSSKGACLAAVKVLQKQRLVVARGPGRYACRIPVERRYRLPHFHGLQPLYDKMRANIDRLAGKNGEPLYARASASRLAPSAFDRVVRGFDEAIDAGASLSQKLMPPGPETPLYFIEARVRRLVAFPPADDAALL